MILSDKEEILELIEMFFEAGKTKDFTILRKIQIDSPEFSSFSDEPPYGLKNYSESKLYLSFLFFLKHRRNYGVFVLKV